MGLLLSAIRSKLVFLETSCIVEAMEIPDLASVSQNISITSATNDWSI